MAEYEDWGSARIAQLEQQDLDLYHRDRAKMLELVRLRRPVQRSEMGVPDYYRRFCYWREDMISVGFPDNESIYIDDFIGNLQSHIQSGVSNCRSRISRLVDAYYEARFVETTILLERMVKDLKAANEIDEMANQTTIEIQRDDGICISVEEESTDNIQQGEPLPVNLEEKVCEPYAHKVVHEMTDSIQAALPEEQLHTKMDHIHTKLDLLFYGTFGDVRTINAQPIEVHKVTRPYAYHIFDEMTLTIRAELKNEQLMSPYIRGINFHNITLFDPGGNVLYAMRSSGGVLPELFGIPLGTGDNGVEGVDWGIFFMEGNTYNVLKEMPKSNSTSKGFNDGVRYRRYTEKEIATQGSNSQISQFRLIPNVQNLWLPSYSKQEEYESQLHCIGSKPSLIYSQVYGEFNAYNHLFIELCCCLFEWIKSKDTKIDRVVSMWNSWEDLLWYCYVMSWRCTRPFDDFNVGALAQRCITCDQPRLNNGHGISAGNAKFHFTSVGMPSQMVSCEVKYCFIGFNHFYMFESDSPATIYLVYDSIAQRDIFSKSLFFGANSMLLRKFLYCWTFPLDKLTIELRLVIFCFDPGEFHRPQMGCDLLEFGGELGNCLGTTKVGVASLRFNDAGRWINLTFDREHYNIFGQHLILYTLEDKGVLKRMGIGIYLASIQDHILSGASAHYYYARTRILARFLVDGEIFSLLIASSIFRIRKSYSLKELLVSFRSVRLDCEDATDAMRFMNKDIKASPQFGLAFLTLGSEHYIWDPGSSAALMGGYRVDAFYSVTTHGINGRDLCGICMRCKAESLLAIGKYFVTTSILMEVTTLTIFVFETKVVRGRVASLEYRGVFVILPSEKHSIQCYDLLLAFSLRSKSQYTLSGWVFMKSTVFGHMVRGFMCQHGAYNIAGLSLIAGHIVAGFFFGVNTTVVLGATEDGYDDQVALPDCCRSEYSCFGLCFDHLEDKAVFKGKELS